MKNKLSILILCLLAVSIRSHDDADTGADNVDDGDVLVMTDDNWNDIIKNNKHVLVELYAPWCGHCKNLAPELAAAATELKSEGIAIAKCDATANSKAASNFKISGYPTMYFFENGKRMDYTGQRKKDDIVSWLRKKSGPASTPLNSVADVLDFAKTADCVVVLIGETGFNNYAVYAKLFDDVVFGHCFNEDCEEHFNIQNSGTVIILKNFDEKRNNLAPGYSESSFSLWINTKTVPLVYNFDTDRAAKFIFNKKTPGLVLFYDKNSQNADTIASAMKEAARDLKHLKGNLQIVVTGITGTEEKKIAESIGVIDDDLPTVRILDTRYNEVKKFRMEGEINPENILAFVENWQKNKLTTYKKSEPIPVVQEDFVQILVGNTYEQIVFDTNKDVLVEFYAPWCGHCKQLAPLYEQLAEKLAHNQNLVIAKIDATANDIPKVSVSSYPTIKFWPANKKSNPINFEGERTIEGFTEFLIKNSKFTVTEFNEDL